MGYLAGLARRLRDSRHARYLRRIDGLLAAPGQATDASAAMRDFDALCRRYAQEQRSGYYEPHPSWIRACQRALWIVENLDVVRRDAATVLEAGCGEGMLGKLLSTYGLRVTLEDLEDWRDPRARDLPLITGELEKGLAIADNSFDLVLSYNSFEHFVDPARCLAELLRVVKPGGLLHADFGPLYASAFGMHAYARLPVPYLQYLFDEPFILEKVRRPANAGQLGTAKEGLQPMNRWKVAQFRALFSGSGAEVLRCDVTRSQTHLGLVQEYPGSFQGRGLTVDDLTAANMIVTLRKSAAR